MPTARFKPYNKRKPYCRKTGGPKYMVSGKSKGRSEAYVKRDLTTLLGALGFNKKFFQRFQPPANKVEKEVLNENKI